MGIVQKDALSTTILSYIGIVLGYLNKGLLFLLVFSTEQIGLINLVLTVGLLFAQLANLGTAYTTWRFLPYFKNAEQRHFGFFPLMLLVACIGMLICGLVFFFFKGEIQQLYVDRSPDFIYQYNWIFPIGIGYVLFLFFESYLRGFYKNVVAVIAFELVLRLLILVALGAFYVHWINFSQFLALHSLFYLVPMLILLVYLGRLGELNLRFSTIKIKKRFKRILMQFSAYNYINTLGASFVTSLDVIMIAGMIGLSGTGVYATIVFLTSALMVPYRSIVRVSSPLVADYWKERDFGKMKELYTNVSSVTLVLGLAMFTYLWMNIDFLMTFIPKDKYMEFLPGIWVFFFLMMGRLLDMFFGLNGSIFSTSKKYKYDLVFTLLLLSLVYGLNLAFIPKWGIVGASISTGIALWGYNIGRLWFVWRVFHIHPFTKNQFVIIAISVVVILFAQWLGTFLTIGWLHFGLMNVLFVALFMAPLLMFNLEPQTKNFVLNFLRKLTRKN